MKKAKRAYQEHPELKELIDELGASQNIGIDKWWQFLGELDKSLRAGYDKGITASMQERMHHAVNSLPELKGI